MNSVTFLAGRCAPARLLTTSAAVLLAFPAVAQTPADPALKEVVVTATRSQQSLSDALPHTTVIGRDVIEHSAANDLPSLLSSEAGFQFVQNGGPGTVSNLFLRGSAGLDVLVLVDGVPLTKQDTTGTVSLEHIMLDQVERVEIVRGNVSAIYGSGAIGGVIQIFMRHGQGKPAGYVQLEAGSYGTAKAVAGLGGQSGATRYALGIGVHGSDAFPVMNASQYPNENPNNHGYHNSNYNLSLSHDFAAAQTLGLRAQGHDGKVDFNGGGFGTITDIYRGRDQSDTWAVYSHNRITPDWRSDLTLSQGHQKYAYDATQTLYPYASESVTNTRTVNWTNNLGLGNWLLTAGAEHQQQQIDTSDSYATQLERQRGVSALFAGVSGSVGPHSLQFNLRHDAPEGMDARTTGYLGYGLQLSPAWKLIASASSAFNLPPLGYLYDPFSGNPDLQPETAHSKELGLQWTQGSQIVRATAFHTRTTDLLLYDVNTYKFGNVSSAINQGLEVSYSGKWHAADLRASLTRQDPIDESTGQQLVRRARTMASAGVSVPAGRWTYGGDLQYTGARPDTSAHPALDAYTLVNLSLRYTLTPEWALTARIDNLFDSQYQTAYGYNQPGRATYVGVVWQQK